jgi:hypothetical protein
MNREILSISILIRQKSTSIHRRQVRWLAAPSYALARNDVRLKT